MNYLFYKYGEIDSNPPFAILKNGYEVEIWRPTLGQWVPQGINWFPYLIWFSFHVFRIFRNKMFSILIIRNQGAVVHRSYTFPRYLRFPLMQLSDVQVGDTWTAPNCRGNGLASFALNYIVAHYNSITRDIWYLVDESNIGSIKAVEKAGFYCFGEGVRKSRFGINMLGYYELKVTYENSTGIKRES
ncbi:MAG: hypothetical protein JKY01_12550 [Pseudomonadales bacterium]|nr:hypothetical protein [Pseudomonadales bacterium]